MEAKVKELKESGCKCRPVYHLSEVIQTCYKEQKYKVGDVRRNCPWGYKEIGDKCFNCKWFINGIHKTMQASGDKIKSLGKFVEQFMTADIDAHSGAGEPKDVGVMAIDIRDGKKEEEKI